MIIDPSRGRFSRSEKAQSKGIRKYAVFCLSLQKQSYKDMIIYEVRKRMGQLDYTTKEIDNYMFRLNGVLRMVEQEFLKYAK